MLDPTLAAGALVGGRPLAVTALALAVAWALRSLVRAWRARDVDRRPAPPSSTTMDDFVDP